MTEDFRKCERCGEVDGHNADCAAKPGPPWSCEFRVAAGCGLRVEDYGYDECDQWEDDPDTCWRSLAEGMKVLRHVFDQWEERGFKLAGRDCGSCGKHLLEYRGGTICPECNRRGRDEDGARLLTAAKYVASLATGYADLVRAIRAYFLDHEQGEDLSATGAWLAVQLGAADELLEGEGEVVREVAKEEKSESV